MKYSDYLFYKQVILQYVNKIVKSNDFQIRVETRVDSLMLLITVNNVRYGHIFSRYDLQSTELIRLNVYRAFKQVQVELFNKVYSKFELID